MWWTPTWEQVLDFFIRSSSVSPDMEEHFGSLPRHAAGLLREGVFLQRGHAGILLWPRPRNVPAHSELLPHREAPLPATRVHPGLRRRARLLRHRARDHWRLLHGGKPALPVVVKELCSCIFRIGCLNVWKWKITTFMFLVEFLQNLRKRLSLFWCSESGHRLAWQHCICWECGAKKTRFKSAMSILHHVWFSFEVEWPKYI